MQGSDRDVILLILLKRLVTFQSPFDLKFSHMSALIEEIENGLDTYEIIKLHPKYAFRIKEIDTLRQTVLSNMFREKKDRLPFMIFTESREQARQGGYIKNTEHPIFAELLAYRRSTGINFDSYHGQSVLVFEEFASQIPIEDMLNYLTFILLCFRQDSTNKVACYDTVYITSNISLGEQYSSQV